MSMLPSFLISSNYPLEKHYFLLPRLALLCIGFYPETIRTWPIRIWAFVNFADISYCCLTSVYLGILEVFVNIPAGLEKVSPGMTGTLSLLKLLMIWKYRKELNIIIKSLRVLFESQKSIEKNKIRRFYFTLVTRMIFILVSWSTMTATFFFISQDINSIWRFFHGEPTSYTTPYQTVFPEFSLHWPWFPFTCFFSHWYGCVTVCSFVAGDGLFFSFCIYITVLMKLLAIDLRDAFGKHSSRQLSATKELEILQNLHDVIERYNQIADIVAKISEVLAIMMLAQFVTSSLIICITAVNLLLFPGYGFLLYGCYVFVALTESFLYCIGGTAVTESSQELANVAYCTPWYTGSVRIQKIILTLILRTQRSLRMKAPFFTPSLPVFTSILRTTGSLIALANSLMQ